MRNSSMGPLHEGSIRRPIAPWANALTTERDVFVTVYQWNTFLFVSVSSSDSLLAGFRTSPKVNWKRNKESLWKKTKPKLFTTRERDVAQSIACPPLKRSVVGSILLSGPSCSLGYFPFQPVVHNWFIKGCGMNCSVYGKVHIKDPLLLNEKSRLCGGSGFPSKKCVNVTIWMTSNNRW